MDKLNPVVVVFALFAVFLTIGAVFVYCNVDGSYTADASMNEDGTISYTISGPSTNYGYSVFSDTEKCECIYLYYDESYAEFFNSKYTQKEYFGVMKQMLERRGATVAYANSSELVEVMKNGNNAVVFVTGALPDTVYYKNDKEHSPFVEWMEKGGTVYWCGPEIGRYVLHTDGVEDIAKGFFGGKVHSSAWTYVSNPSEMFEYTQIRHDNCAYGLSTDVPNSKPLSYVSDDGYSTVSVAKLYNGNVTVWGGNMATMDTTTHDVSDRTAAADLMICGLKYDSKGLEHGTGQVIGKVSSTTTKNVSSYDGVSIWISCGEPASHWSKCIRFY